MSESTGCAFGAEDPLPFNYRLAKHMEDEHGLILIDSELSEIMRICRELELVAAEQEKRRHHV